MHRWALSLVLLSACLTSNPSWGDTTDGEVTGPIGGTGDTIEEGTCEPLAPVGADAIAVTPADNSNLQQIIASAPPGAVVALADGVYERDGLGRLEITADGLTLRSGSGDPEAVILQGGTINDELLSVVGASGVTIAELTLRNNTNLMAARAEGAPVDDLTIYRVRFRNASDYQFRALADRDQGVYLDRGTVACSHFETDDAFRASLSTDECGLRALEVQSGQGWVFRDNVVRGAWCREGFASAAVRFHHGARDTLVERNDFVDNYRSLIIGNDDSGDVFRDYADNPCTPGVYWGEIGGVVRNNFFWVGGPSLAASGQGADSVISLWHACGTSVHHNTVVNLIEVFHGIEYRFERTTVTIANNLVTADIASRSGAVAQMVDTNLTEAPQDLFVDPIAGDLHLLSSADVAIDAAAPMPTSPTEEDFDRDARDAAPDIGADEFVQ